MDTKTRRETSMSDATKQTATNGLRTIRLTLSFHRGIRIGTIEIDGKCIIPKVDSLPRDLTPRDRDICIDLIAASARATA